MQSSTVYLINKNLFIIFLKLLLIKAFFCLQIFFLIGFINITKNK